MDGEGRWELVYGPIYSNYDGTDVYDEPRYLFRNLDKEGFWTKEVPLRYVRKI